MVTIYCIEDINDLKYVGSTIQEINKRLRSHINDKKIGRNTSSKQLNLYNCIIYALEECSEEDRKERERDWINKLDCVNTKKLNYTQSENHKKWREKNRDYYNQYRKEWRKKKAIDMRS